MRQTRLMYLGFFQVATAVGNAGFEVEGLTDIIVKFYADAIKTDMVGPCTIRTNFCIDGRWFGSDGEHFATANDHGQADGNNRGGHVRVPPGIERMTFGSGDCINTHYEVWGCIEKMYRGTTKQGA